MVDLEAGAAHQFTAEDIQGSNLAHYCGLDDCDVLFKFVIGTVSLVYLPVATANIKFVGEEQ